MSKVTALFSRIKRNKQLFLVVLIVAVIILIKINYFIHWEIVSAKNIFGIALIILLGTLVAELALRLVLGFNMGLVPFANFVKYVYEHQADDFFPNQGLFPDFQYYAYHPFYHFSLKPSVTLKQDTIEINALGFRGKDNDPGVADQFNVYLSGDCQFFEQHLPDNDTFAAKLANNLSRQDKKAVVHNAGGPHYTILHCLNRMIIDQNRLNINLIILSAGINDVVVFLHAPTGQVPPDYTNFYKSFSEDRILKGFHDLWLVRNLKIIQLYKFLRIREWLMFDHSIESRNETFYTAENAARARQIFSPRYFENYLKKYICICQCFNIPLVLMTPKYNPSDMVKPAQQFIAFGIEQIIAVQKKLAAQFRVPLIDCQGQLPSRRDVVFNKWHFCGMGNEQRARLASEYIGQRIFKQTL